ncbi:hypothetical protein KHA80_15875 [Anaerobacillus sp. HL2]|nr:hypothetical protein KHA80_15875 [Anaerobacillus sp. HL2]
MFNYFSKGLGSVDETKPFDTYNWGYDTVHFNAIEGSYSFILKIQKNV